MKSVCSYSISAWSGNSTLAAALCTAVVFFETCYPHQKLEICCQILLIEPQKKPWYTEDRRKATGKKKLKPCGKKRQSFQKKEPVKRSAVKKEAAKGFRKKEPTKGSVKKTRRNCI